MGELNFFLNREPLTAAPYKQTHKQDAALDPRTLFEHSPLRVMKRARRHALRAWGLRF